jgi:hypothetical protein
MFISRHCPYVQHVKHELARIGKDYAATSRWESWPFRRTTSLVMEPTERWTPQLASDLYDVASWGKGYFSVGDNGHVRVHPEKDPARSIDLKQLVDTLVLRGISLPILIRFADILKHRLGEMHDAFETAIAEHATTAATAAFIPSRSTSSARWWKRCWNSASRSSSAWKPAPSRTAGRDGAGRQRNADHLQRLQRRRIHRDGHAGAEDRAADHPGGRKVHRAGT